MRVIVNRKHPVAGPHVRVGRCPRVLRGAPFRFGAAVGDSQFISCFDSWAACYAFMFPLDH